MMILELLLLLILPDRYFLTRKDNLIRITDEGNIKVTMHINQSNPELKSEIKLKRVD